MTTMQKVLLIIFVKCVLGVVAYDLLGALQDCERVGAKGFNLPFNADVYRIKEVIVSSNSTLLLSKRFWNQTPFASATFDATQISTYDLQFIFVADETRACYRIGLPSPPRICPVLAKEIACQPLPVLRAPVHSTPWSPCRSLSVDGYCIVAGGWQKEGCQELEVWNVFETVVTSPARVISGFRLNDCTGTVLEDPIPLRITVREGDVELLPSETKQQVVPITNGTRFVQLMVSLCPRTAVGDIIDGLNVFVATVNMSSSYIAITVFDGGFDYVDLVHFTNNAALINSTIANLVNYKLRDDTCNVRQSITKKFAETSAYIYGQPYDTLSFVIYTATGDLANYITDENVVVMPVGRRRDISTFVIGQRLPDSQASLFRYLGSRGLYQTNDRNSTIQAFKDVATSINVTSAGFNIFGYCSASRAGKINAKLLFTSFSSTLMELSYNSSVFTPGCTEAHARDFCNPCSTVIDRHHLLCYECFSQSFIPLTNGTDYAQVLLRVPGDGPNYLQLPLPNTAAKFDIYVRVGGLSNPLLYNQKFLAVAKPTVELIGLNKGDLIGVYINWNGFPYDPSAGIKIVSEGVYEPMAAPVTVQQPIDEPLSLPVGQQPIAASATPNAQSYPIGQTPLSPPTTVSRPIAEQVPTAGPGNNGPVGIPSVEPVAGAKASTCQNGDDVSSGSQIQYCLFGISAILSLFVAL